MSVSSQATVREPLPDGNHHDHPTGLHPGPIVAVTTAAGPGFVVLNSGSSTLTELSGFNGTTFSSVRTLNAGGFNPVAVVTVSLDIPGVTFGLTDLIVADADTDEDVNPATGEDTGNLTLLVGDDTGFADDQTFTDPGIPNPSDVALSAVDDGVFYATTDGVEQAFRFQIDVTPPAPVSTIQPVAGGSPVAFAPAVVPGNGVALVATVPNSNDNLPAAFPQAAPNNIAGIAEGLLTSVSGTAINGSALVGGEAGSNGTGLDRALSLIVSADGGKGTSNDAWQRLIDTLEEANDNWAGALLGQSSRALLASRETLQGVNQVSAALVNSVGQRLSLDQLNFSDLQWREIGVQMWEIGAGSVHTTWNGSALAEMAERYLASVEEFISPWVPTEEPGTMSETLPMLAGACHTWQGIGAALPALGASELPLQDTVDAVSRSLLETFRLAPSSPAAPRPRPESRPIFLAGETESQFPLPLVESTTRRDWLLDSASREEQPSVWLMLAAVAALPLYAPLCVADEEDRSRLK